jgi:hypothetical protein
MPDIEIHVDLGGHVRRVGLARLNKVRGTETITFEYIDGWLTDPDCFSIEPALIELGRLLQSTERLLRDEETDEDLQ